MPTQVGNNVWIKPSNYKPEDFKQHEEYFQSYFYVDTNGVAQYCRVLRNSFYWAVLDSGNIFKSKEEAENAIIKPVSSKPLTYDEFQLSDGKYEVYAYRIVFTDSQKAVINSTSVRRGIPREVFELGTYWKTREAAEQWLKENVKDCSCT